MTSIIWWRLRGLSAPYGYLAPRGAGRGQTLLQAGGNAIHGLRLSAQTRDDMLVMIAAKPTSIEVSMKTIGHLRRG